MKIQLLNKFKELVVNSFQLSSNEGNRHLTLRGFYYHLEADAIKIIFKLKRNRMTYRPFLKDVINDKNLINQCHPLEAIFIGIYANLERNGLLTNKRDASEIIVDIQEHYFPRFSGIIKISSIYYSEQDGCDMLSLKAKHLNKEIHIPISKMIKNLPLLCALDPNSALSLGYNLVEERLRLGESNNGNYASKKH